jgi:putative ABC transport system permease protein
VALTVILYSYFNGVEIDAIRNYAVFATGHVKAMSRAYAAQAELIPNDLALLGVDSLMQDLETNYPQVRWTGRIRFGGLLDIPDENNETRIQGPVTGLAVDLFSADTPEIDFLGLHRSLVQGKLPQRPGEVLIAEEYAGQLGLSAGSRVTLVSATMNGSLALENFLIAGTVRFAWRRWIAAP